MVRRFNTVVARASIEAEADPGFFLARVPYMAMTIHSRSPLACAFQTHYIDWKQKVLKFNSSILMG